MANPYTGEVVITLNNTPHVCKLTLGALAELEADLGDASLVDLVQRFEAGQCSGRDVLALILAGLRGGGWQGTSSDLIAADIAGGPLHAARKAAELLACAFSVPE